MATASEVGPRPIAGTIGLVFGGLWSLLAATGLPHSLQWPALVLGGLVTISLVTALWMHRNPARPSTDMFKRRGYIIAVVLEFIAIYAASTLFARYSLKPYLVQAVGVIVGLHFIGLWQATRSTRFLWIAGCMCSVSAFAAWLPDSYNGFNPREVITGLGNAMTLWIGASRR
jgi:hypothetical protein